MGKVNLKHGADMRISASCSLVRPWGAQGLKLPLIMVLGRLVLRAAEAHS